jgi:chemotaxis protein MotB
MPHDQSPVAVTIELPEPPEHWETEGEPAGTVAEEGEGPEVGSPEPDENDLQEMLAKREEEQFKKAEEALRQAIESVPDLRELAENLVIDRTPEGMRIQIVDQDGSSMFPNGSAEMFEHTRRLLALVVDAVRQMPQQIAIKGHTDAKPFSDRSNYTNWELSTDRANSSRRALLESGLPAARVASVAGLADTDPLDPEHPHAPQNRRVSIILLRENPLVAAPASDDGVAPAAGPQRAAAE